ncbi:TolC family protein [Betaproteobacteria bacterium]|nr:TolC family protein [Betaproteobacteria bacterium]
MREFLGSLVLPLFLFGNAHAITLQECIEAALVNNPELKKARAEFNSFKEREDQSFADLLPSISLSVSRSKVDQDRSDNSRPTISQKYTTESDSLTLRQPLYRPSLLRNYEKSKLDTNAQKNNLDYQEDLLEMKVIEAYFQLLQSFARKSLIEKKITLLEEQGIASEKSIQAGVGTITEKVELQAELDKAQVEIISIDQNITVELNELSFLTGLKVNGTNGFKFNERRFKALEEKNIEQWESSALANNYRTKAIRNQILALEKDLSSQKFSRYPSLDLTLQMAKGSSESTFFVNSETKSNSIGLSLFVPIYQGGGISSKIREAAFNLEAEKQALVFEEDELRKSVQKAFYGMRENLKLVSALQTAIRSAEIVLDANIKSTQAGVRRQLDVLIAQQKLIRVENDLIQARVNVILFWSQLRMLSGLLDQDSIKFLNDFLDG